MTGNMLSLSWQRREHGKRHRRNRRITVLNVHSAAEIAGGSGGKPSACLTSKTKICIYVLAKMCTELAGEPKFGSTLPANVGPTWV
jgi:hypothetical protein